jgi:hypothetical protein
MPKTLARINGADELQEIRTFSDEEIEIAKATGIEIGTPVPHKDVRWIPYVERGLEEVDQVTHDVRVSNSIVNGEYEVRYTGTPKDPQPYRDHAIADTRRIYRDRIIDALPDMKLVTELATVRDAKIAELYQEADIIKLIGMSRVIKTV